MKLSEIKGERSLDVIAEIMPSVMNIAKDPFAVELFRQNKVIPDGVTKSEFVADVVKANIPGIIKNNKADLVIILASLANVDPAEYRENMNLASLTNDLIELLTDDCFIQLFPSAQKSKIEG